MTKLYQWLKGDKVGDIVEWQGDIVSENGLNFLVFTDGSRGNESLMGDFYIEIPNRDEPFIDINLMKGEPVRFPQDNNPPLTRVQPNQNQIPVRAVETNPISKLLGDSKKTKTTVDISLIVDMPPSDLMKVLSESYEDGEKQVLQYLADTVDINNIQKQIAEKIWQQLFTKRKRKKINEGV